MNGGQKSVGPWPVASRGGGEKGGNFVYRDLPGRTLVMTVSIRFCSGVASGRRVFDRASSGLKVSLILPIGCPCVP